MDEEDQPILTAVSSSARQLYLLLRCINFAEKAHVQISDEGLKFSVDEASVMEGSAFLAKSLFTTYTFHTPPPQAISQDPSSDEENEGENDDLTSNPTFQISLPSLLETLQIFGIVTDPSSQKPPWSRDNPTSTAFSNSVLGMHNLCRIIYASPGSPLTVILTEASIRTTCELTTYEPAFAEEIPFDRMSLAFKTIMRGGWLGDAVGELSSTSPERLTLWARMRGGKPYFALSSSGTLGSARVEFNNTINSSSAPAAPPPMNPSGTTSAQDQPLPQPAQANVLETFQLGDPRAPLRASYKFSLIQRAARAMSVASKVSIRVDAQGVLNLQFMIEVESGKASFVDFRFVPLVEGEDDDEGDETMLADGENSAEEDEEDEEGAEDEEMLGL